MSNPLIAVFSRQSGSTRRRIVGIYAVLISLNLAAWAWAFIAFHRFPLLLGTALLAYGFGLRHAVDADHIAAIDNVTRKLMQAGKRPVDVGFFFSLGHSTIVVIASVAVAVSAMAVKSWLGRAQEIGGLIGTLVSATFLLAIALMNVIILVAVYRTFQRVRAGHRYVDDDLNTLLAGRGFLARLFRPVFAMITESWQMYPLGVLFGLGFDTATEVGLLGIAAAEATKGLPSASILVFPALFTVGMMLIDTTDGILMLGAYGWAFINPIRKLYYNLTILSFSVMVALIVGGIEALGAIAEEFAMKGRFWGAINALNNHFGTVGFLIIGLFAATWIGSTLIYRMKGFDRLEVGA